MKLIVVLVMAWLSLPAAAPAQTTLGLPPSAREQPESVEELLDKAEQGDARSQYALAVHYASRGSGQLAADEAVYWLLRAAEQGHAEAQSDLGLLYHRGLGVPPDPAEAAKWLRRAAEQGHANSQADLGRLYYLGAGVPRDFSKAAEWYRAAAEQGVAAAQYNLAGLFVAGEGVLKSAVEAGKWYREAAGLGLSEAQYALAAALVRGEGVSKNSSEAVRWARAAAVRGHAQAQLLLARQYENGLGVERDIGRALQWYRFAAELGLVEAQRSLGVLYAEGRGGAVDLVQGRIWLVIAALNAPEGRRAEIAPQRDEVGRGMTAEQIAETERSARLWKSKTWGELKAGTPGELIPGGRSTDLSSFFGTAGRNISAAEGRVRRVLEATHRERPARHCRSGRTRGRNANRADLGGRQVPGDPVGEIGPQVRSGRTGRFGRSEHARSGCGASRDIAAKGRGPCFRRNILCAAADGSHEPYRGGGAKRRRGVH